MFGNKEKKEEKQQRKLQEAMKKYRLDEVNPEYAEAVKDINLRLSGTDMVDFGTFFAGEQKGIDPLIVAYFQTLIEQNWIMIRQLDKIASNFDK